MKVQQDRVRSRGSRLPQVGGGRWPPGSLERDFGRLEATVEGLRRDVDDMKNHSSRRASEARADRRTWLLALLPTAAFVADIVAHFVAR
jgi:hypothetical protein